VAAASRAEAGVRAVGEDPAAVGLGVEAGPEAAEARVVVAAVAEAEAVAEEECLR
jgi:hypothetical protein